MHFVRGYSTLPVQNLLLWGVSWVLPVPLSLFLCLQLCLQWKCKFLCRCELVDAGFGRDVMLCAGRRIPARNASVDGTCLCWLADPGWVWGRIQGRVLAPLTSQWGEILTGLTADTAAGSWSQLWAPHAQSLWLYFTLLWKISLLGVVTELHPHSGGLVGQAGDAKSCKTALSVVGSRFHWFF